MASILKKNSSTVYPVPHLTSRIDTPQGETTPKFQNGRPSSCSVRAGCEAPADDNQLASSNVEHSISSSSSLSEAIHDSVEQQSGGRASVVRLVMLLLVVAFPVTTLIGICAFQLGSSVTNYGDVQLYIADVEEFLRLDTLINGLQLERGTSAALVISEGSNTRALDKLRALWTENDVLLLALTRWPTDGLALNMSTAVRSVVDESTVYRPSGLLAPLGSFRQLVVNGSTVFGDELTFYSAIIDFLIRWSLVVVIKPDMTNIWPKVFSTASLLRAANYVGVQRAVGTMFVGCKLANESLSLVKWATSFVANGGSANSLLTLAFNFQPQVERLYIKQFIGTELEANLTMMTAWIVEQPLSGNGDHCNGLSEVQRNDRMNFWQVRCFLMFRSNHGDCWHYVRMK